MAEFKVLRQHFGDRLYREGEVRQADEADVRHLIGRVLEKMEPAPKNKAEPKLRNKSR